MQSSNEEPSDPAVSHDRSTPEPTLGSNGMARYEVPSPKTPEARSDSHVNLLPTTPKTLSPEQMSKITSNLRTRLSFAVVKVKHGWTTQSLEQLENLHRRSGYYRNRFIIDSPLEPPRTPQTKLISNAYSVPYTPQTTLALTPSPLRRAVNGHKRSQSFDIGRSGVRSRHKRPLSISIPNEGDKRLHSEEASPEVEAVKSLIYLSSPRAPAASH